MGNQVAQRTLHPQLFIFDHPTEPLGPKATPFATIPRSILRLMGTRRHPDEPRARRTIDGKPLVSIPATFKWFTVVLFQEMLRPNKDGRFDYTAKFTTDQLDYQYGLPDEAVQDWTNAYSVSGLFNVVKGTRPSPTVSGSPTFFQYVQSAALKDWECFITGLNNVLNPENGQRMKRHGVGTNEFSAAEVFTFCVALAVDNARAKAGLSPVNQDFLNKCVKDGVAVKDGPVYRWHYAKPPKNFDAQAVEVNEF
jgi:hypothetical protein